MAVVDTVPSPGAIAADPYAGDALPPRVEVKNRPLRDRVALGIFLVALVVNIALGIVVATGVKDAVTIATEFNTCVADNNAAQVSIPVDDVKADSAAVKALASSAFGSISIEGITNSPGLIAGLSFAVVAVAGLWVFLLYRFTKIIVWGTLFFNIAIVAVVGVIFLLAIEGGATAGGVYLAVAAIQGLVLYCIRNNVNMAAGLINLAMQALRDFPSLILAGILINVLVLALYIMELVFILSAMLNIGYVTMSGADILAMENPVTPSLTIGGVVTSAGTYCVVQQTGVAQVSTYVFAVLLLWVSATLEAVRMAIAAAVFGVFYYFAPDDPEKPSNIVCMATTWAFTKQLGTHAISGMVLAIIDYLKRLAKSRAQGVAGLIIRLIVLCILSLIEQLSKFLVIMTGLTGLSFWDSAKRTVTLMKEVFVDGYITSRITIRVLRLSGFIFSLVFAIVAWAGVDSTSIQTLWFFVFLIIVGIISPIFGIILAIVLSSLLGAVFKDATGSGSNPLSGPLAGLFFGSIAHAVILFMEQLILDLVDAAFVCFALDAHNGIISPRGEVVHRFMGANFADQLSDEGKASAAKAGPADDVVENPVADGFGGPGVVAAPAPAALSPIPGMVAHPVAAPPPAAPAYPGDDSGGAPLNRP